MQEMDDEGIFTIKSSILDEIQNVVFLFQTLNDLVAIAMVAVSQTAIPAIAAEKVATQSVFKLIVKFLIKLLIMQALPYVAEKIIS